MGKNVGFLWFEMGFCYGDFLLKLGVSDGDVGLGFGLVGWGFRRILDHMLIYMRFIWSFHSHGGSPIWMVYGKCQPQKKLMLLGGSPS